MESSKYLEDLASIKSMMHKSSRFMSLSGPSGILAGIYALIGAYVAHSMIIENRITFSQRQNFIGQESEGSLIGLINAITGNAFQSNLSIKLLLVGALVAIAAIITGIVLTYRKAQRQEEKIWDASSKRLLIHFMIPLCTGGAFCVVLLQYGLIGLVGPCSLIFYGLALINASKFTLGDIKFLGLANVIIGLVSTQFVGYGLYFWALGFGVFHIFYGTLMYLKYDRNAA